MNLNGNWCCLAGMIVPKAATALRYLMTIHSEHLLPALWGRVLISNAVSCGLGHETKAGRIWLRTKLGLADVVSSGAAAYTGFRITYESALTSSIPAVRVLTLLRARATMNSSRIFRA